MHTFHCLHKGTECWNTSGGSELCFQTVSPWSYLDTHRNNRNHHFLLGTDENNHHCWSRRDYLLAKEDGGREEENIIIPRQRTTHKWNYCHLNCKECFNLWWHMSTCIYEQYWDCFLLMHICNKFNVPKGNTATCILPYWTDVPWLCYLGLDYGLCPVFHYKEGEIPMVSEEHENKYGLESSKPRLSPMKEFSLKHATKRNHCRFKSRVNQEVEPSKTLYSKLGARDRHQQKHNNQLASSFFLVPVIGLLGSKQTRNIQI